MKPKPLKHFAHLLSFSSVSTKVVTGVSIDSRKIERGDLYFALTGKKVDGHTFLEEVAHKGAIGAVVQSHYQGPDFGLELIRVPDVIAALHEMARKTVESFRGKIVGITGSIGKTTTKEFTADLLKTKFSVARTPLSYNSQATLPLSILQFAGDEEIFVLEMGMSEPGEIAKLVAIAPPDIAVITTVSQQHTSSFPDGILGVEREKGMILSHPKTRIGILNRDMPSYERIQKSGSCKKITFSTHGNLADYRLEILDKTIVVNEREVFDKFLPADHHYQNFLAASIVAYTLGMSSEEIRRASVNLKLPPMRFERVEKKGVLFINDAYNANPEATAAALKALPEPAIGGKRIAVLSEMNALGVHNVEGHQLVAESALHAVDEVLLLGKNCEVIKNFFDKNQKRAQLVETKEALLAALRQRVNAGDVVLLKGARAYALEEILQCF